MSSAIKEIATSGGKNVYDLVYRATQKLETNKLAAGYSYFGRGKKLKFSSLKLNGLLIKAALKIFPNCSEKEAEVTIAKAPALCRTVCKNSVEIKMSSNEMNENAPTNPTETSSIHMESINRIAHLPAVEQTVQVATSIYGAVKDCSSVTNWTLTTAETTAHKAVEISKPILSQFEGPIKKVDEMLCTGLDYVEEKVPAVKLPPGEMYTTTKDYVSNKIQPAVDAAKHVVEPAVNSVRGIAEPYIQPAVDTACAIKDYGYQKVGEILHLNQEAKAIESKSVVECQDCVENSEKPKSIHSE
ncbi:hypothetical protein RN001_002933 [Aquatica leii]|uniref:Uncharacterized protein n=1 Tax=Aquatica leii TaxID=1421715 RepID=A0AAN7PHK1_9COLE|nr:hypothetical protein RN001_002933 [Aquatica leii]